MISEDKQKVLDLYADGRKLYKLMEFEQAKECFANALKVDANDGPSKVFYVRCKHYMENPPPEDWDGVYVMTTK